MEKQYFNPPETHNWPQFFSQAVAAPDRGTRTIYISGQVGVGADGKVVAKGDLAAQARQVFYNLEAVLRVAGAGIGDVVKINAYVVGLDGEKSSVVGAELLKHFPGPNQPASTWIGVTSLVGRDYLLEVEAVAVAPV